MGQRSVPVVYMRGGTSRALMFHQRDLPLPPADASTAAQDALFRAALGSPDPYRRQLDGMGGGVSSLSKIAIIGPPSDPRADVDYTFAQVDVLRGTVNYRGNCGNISSAVGPFAVDEGLVRATDGHACVTIHNTNTRKLIQARFAVIGGQAAVAGDFVLDGVAGTGAPIELAFLDPGGAATGKLLPTGHPCNTLEIPALGRVEVSIVDASNPTVFVRAEALRLTGTEKSAELAANAAILEALQQIRMAAAVAAGMIADPAEALTVLHSLPLVCIVARADDDGVGPPRITVRMISSDQPHGASPLTGAMCLAVAAQLPGTLVAETMRRPDDGRVVILHASGSLPVAAIVASENGVAVAKEAVVHRTARRLMDGRVYVA